jgi:ATP-dependent RNA helicase SUPV3L1/SUV3
MRVDYLIATDAIGMGLNLDVDHVAFAQNRKFDGYQFRQLTAAELGQIAGRAGRHMRDGTFGVTGQVDPFDEDLVEKIEGHDFDPVRVLQWRTADFDFSSLKALRASLDTTAPVEGLTRALPAVDQVALEQLTGDPDIARLADRPRRVELLWEACALPDYRKIAPAQHAELVASIFRDLAERGHVDEDYMADQVSRVASTEGDIDTLTNRIAQVRTWTYVSHRPGWMADAAHWQEKTRDIEDRLSDALHERLTKRFVDRRTSVLMRRLRENTMLEAEIGKAGEVLVEGHHVGELLGFRFTADQTADGEDARAVRAAAQKALAAEFDIRADRFAACPNGDLALASDGMLRWQGMPVGVLAAGDDPLRPRVILLADEQLTGPARDKVAARLERFVNFQIESLLKPLIDLKNADSLAGMARGVAFRLVENFGIVNRREIADDVKALDQDARGALRQLGVRFGAYHVFIPTLLKPGPAGLASHLWALANDARERDGYGDVIQALASGRTSLVVDPAYDANFYRLAGYRVLGKRAVRVDILERLADLIRPALAWRVGTGKRPDGAFEGGTFMVTPSMMSILGAKAEDMEEILKGLGYRSEPRDSALVTRRTEEIDAAEAARLAGPAAADHGDSMADPNVAATAVEAPSEEAATADEPASVDADAAQQIAGPDISLEAPHPDQAGLDHGDMQADPDVSPTVEQADQPVPALPEEPAEEPKPILLWRPGRFEGRGRNQQNRRNQRNDNPRTGDRPRQPRPDQQQAGNPRERNNRKGGKPGGGKFNRNEQGRPERQHDTAAKARPPREDKPVRIDPDSPFAKLAALRDQLRKP